MTDWNFSVSAEGREDRWSYASGSLELLEEAKQKGALIAGLWTSFCPSRKPAKVFSNLGTTPYLLSRPEWAKAAGTWKR